ncbi:MarR family transcriptional regulator [Streptomyces sioyaensis]|uniref:MarR family transcriptional regulator n=1 Tax=Streptomyces sioyaensis TaxID=67364 RepID=UPI0037D231F9
MSPSIDHSSRPYPEYNGEIAEELQAAVTLLARRLRRELSPQGVTLSQATALQRLEREGPQTVAGLARAENVRVQSMAATINAAEAAGLVQRTPRSSCGRQLLITLTGSGRKLLQKHRQVENNRLARRMAECLEPAELKALKEATEILVRIAKVE